MLISFRDISLLSECNKDCGCTTSGYEPVCDHSNVVYFSPCHAGCSSIKTINGSKVRVNLAFYFLISKINVTGFMFYAVYTFMQCTLAFTGSQQLTYFLEINAFASEFLLHFKWN